jgi:hypothetical protein
VQTNCTASVFIVKTVMEPHLGCGDLAVMSFRCLWGVIAMLPAAVCGMLGPIVGALAFVAAGPAAADNCTYHVGAPGQGDYVICDPAQTPRPQPHFPIPHYSVYAVIAGSERTGYSTMVWHYESLERAKAAALAKCGRMAPDCQVREWTPHCVAQAESPNHRTWGVAEDWLMDKAQAEALRQCRLGGGVQCRSTVHHCAADTP